MSVLIQNESGDEMQDQERSSEALNQTNQGGMPLYEITEQSQRIEEIVGMDAPDQQHIDDDSSKQMMQDASSKQLQCMTIPMNGSGDLPTNPTFVSVHQADAEMEDFMQSHQFMMIDQHQQLQQELIMEPADLDDSAVEVSHFGQKLFVWGSNSFGQLGLKSANFGRFELPQPYNFKQKIVMISCGMEHTAMVTDTNQLYVMGSNQHAQLGLGNPTDIQKCTVPTLVQALAHIQVHQVACGANHTLAIGSEIIGQRTKSCFAWGDNSKGQTGLPGTSTVFEPRKVEFSYPAGQSTGQDNSNFKICKISAGQEHTFFLDTKRWQVLACGESRQGQLGIGRRHEVIFSPQRVDTLCNERIVEVSVGDNHTLALNYEGQVLASGSNVSGQLGLGHTDSQHEFCLIPELSNILHVCASSHSTAIDCDGRLYRWGQGVKGVYLAPLKIASPRPTFIDEVSMGHDFGIVRNKNGELFSYGLNSSGQLGLGDSESRSTLNSLVTLNQQGAVQTMAAGSNFVVCLVDTTQKLPQAYFQSEIVLSNQFVAPPDSAPSRKKDQQFAHLRSAGQQTSVTDFKEMGGNQELFAITTEKRGDSNSGLNSTVQTGAFNSRAETRVSFKPKTQKVFSQQGLPLAKDFAECGLPHQDNHSNDNGTIQTHQTAQNTKEMHAIRHEISGDEYFYQQQQQDHDESQISHQFRQRPPRKQINPHIKQQTRQNPHRQQKQHQLQQQQQLQQVLQPQSGRGCGVNSNSYDGRIYGDGVDNHQNPVTSQTNTTRFHNVTVATAEAAEFAVGAMIPPYTSSPFQASRVNLPQSSNVEGGQHNVVVDRTFSQQHHVVQQQTNNQSYSVSGTEATSMRSAITPVIEDSSNPFSLSRTNFVSTSNRNLNKKNSDQHLKITTNKSILNQEYPGANSNSRNQHNQEVDTSETDATNLAQKYQLRSNFARSQSHSHSRSRERPVNVQHQTDQPQQIAFLQQPTTSDYEESVIQTPHTVVNYNRLHQGMTNQYAGLDKIPVRQDRHKEPIVARHSHSPIKSIRAHGQFPSFSANVPNQFRSRSSVNGTSSRRGTKGKTSLETTGQFVSQYGQKLAQDFQQHQEQQVELEVVEQPTNSGVKHHTREPSAPQIDYLPSNNLYQNIGGQGLVGHGVAAIPSQHYSNYYKDQSQSSMVEEQSSYDAASRQMQTLDYMQSQDCYQQDSQQYQPPGAENSMRMHRSDHLHHFQYKQQHEDFLTSSNLNGTTTDDLERTGSQAQDVNQRGSEVVPSQPQHETVRYGNNSQEFNNTNGLLSNRGGRAGFGDKSGGNNPYNEDLSRRQEHHKMMMFRKGVGHHLHNLPQQLQDINELTTSTGHLTSTLNQNLTTGTLDTFKTLEEDQQQQQLHHHQMMQQYHRKQKHAQHQPPGAIRSKSSNHHHYAKSSNATPTCCNHGKQLQQMMNESGKQNNNGQLSQMKSFDFRNTNVNRSMMATPVNANISKTPSGHSCCQQAGTPHLSLMTAGAGAVAPNGTFATGGATNGSMDQPLRHHKSSSCRRHHHHKHSSKIPPISTVAIAQGTSKSRSRSRCPMCRNEESCHNHQSNGMVLNSQATLISNHHQHNKDVSCAGQIPPSSSVTKSQHHYQQQRDLHNHQQHAAAHMNLHSQLNNTTTNQQHDRKLRKKYKKLKLESQRTQIKLQQEAEKLKVRVHELQSMLQQKEATERKNEIQRSEGYQGLVHKYTLEVSSLQDKNCQLERTLVARESQLKVITKENEDSIQQNEQLRSELEISRQKNEELEARTKNLANEVDGFKLTVTEKERSVELLRDQLDQKTRTCLSAENSISHLNQTLENLNNNFRATKLNAEGVLVENDQLRLEIRGLNSNLEIYAKQLEHLRVFIEELESNNKELVRFIDQKNFQQANDYKTKVASLLSKQRNSTSNNVASLRAPGSFNNEDDTSQHNYHQNNNAVNETHMFNPLLQSSNNEEQLNDRSNSPVTRPMQRIASFNDPTIGGGAGLQVVDQHMYQQLTQNSVIEEQQHQTQVTHFEQMEQQNRRLSSPMINANNYGQQSSVAEFGRASAQEHQYKTQQHCVRRKSPQKPSNRMGSAEKPPFTQQMQQWGTQKPHAVTQQSPAPGANLDHRQRYQQIIEREKKEMEEARNSLPSATVNTENDVSPTIKYLAKQTSNFIDKATRYQRSSINQDNNSANQVDPRDRLRAEQTSYHAVRHQTSRSISPAQVLSNSNTNHQTSRFSNNERSVSAGRGAGGHNRSVDSQAAASNNPNNLVSAHFASQDSLKVQYQKVTEALPTFSRSTRRNQHQEVSRSQAANNSLVEVPAQSISKLHDKLSDIQSVLATSPGKSKKFMSRSKSPMKTEGATTPTGLMKKYSLPGFKENVTETYQQFNPPNSQAATNSAQDQTASQPKVVTSQMMRSQLNQINESLAQMKRNRMQIEGQMVNYQEDKE